MRDSTRRLNGQFGAAAGNVAAGHQHVGARSREHREHPRHQHRRMAEIRVHDADDVGGRHAKAGNHRGAKA